MTKKRLSDLLKEEVTKAESPSDGVVEAPVAAVDAAKPTAEATPAPPPRRSATSRRGAAGRSASTAKSSKPAAKATAQPKPTTPEPDPQATATSSDLSQRLATLEDELAAAKKDNARLEKTVTGLQKDLETQQSRLFELKDSLAQAEELATAKDQSLAKVQAELDEAKQTILKLSAAPKAAPAPARISGVDILPRRPVDTTGKPTYHRGVPEYSIQTGQPNSMLSDADIGWVD